MTSPKWEVYCTVWDEQDWERIPMEITEVLLELRRVLGQTRATKFDVSLNRRV